MSVLRAVPAMSAAVSDERPFDPGFGAFYERHFRFVFRVVSRLADHEADVEDLTQEIFAIAAQKLPEFEGRAKETTWLYRIAANVVSAERRKRRRQHVLGLRWLKPDPDELLVDGPDRDVERGDARTLVHGLLQKLSEKKRTVFLLYELEGLSGQEIAEIVDCPLDTVWTRLFHARRDFKKLLAERGYTSLADLEALPEVSR